MAEMVNFIWRWLESGDDHATGNAKSTWNETKDIFKMVMDALTSISKNFQGVPLHSDPRERMEARRELRGENLFKRVEKFFGDLEKIMTEDEQHRKNQETDEKLRQLIQNEEIQKLLEALKESPKVN